MKYPITAARLKEALNDNHMKPQELSDASGVNKSSISQYVNGSHAPSNTSSGAMARVLKVSPLWLMGFDAPKYDAPASVRPDSLSFEEQEVIISYRKASEDTKNAVAAVLGVQRKKDSTLSKAE